MEPLFKNRCIYNKDVFYEGAKAAIKPAFKVFCKILLAFGIVSSVLSLILTGKSTTSITCLMLLIVIVMFVYAFPKRLVKLSTKGVRFDENGEVINDISFFEEELILDSDVIGHNVKYKYSQIKDVKETEKLILLMMDMNRYVIITKKSFENDKLNSFKEFLKNVRSYK